LVCLLKVWPVGVDKLKLNGCPTRQVEVLVHVQHVLEAVYGLLIVDHHEEGPEVTQVELGQEGGSQEPHHKENFGRGALEEMLIYD